ncbi:hypothetical protein OAX38_00690 [Flavobacteriaceae bacterium]|nr:hypothetical protein [Flavobacteriaceae bacterium]
MKKKSENREMIVTLSWLFLNIFSVLGLMGYQELLPSLKWEIDDNLIILWPINWFLCHYLAFKLFKKRAPVLALVSYAILLASGGIVLFIGELVIGFFIVDSVIGFDGFFGPLIYFFLFLVIAVKGGIRQIILKLLDILQNFNDAFFESLTRNTINSALEKAEKNKKVLPPIIQKKKQIDKLAKDLEDDLKNYS